MHYGEIRGTSEKCVLSCLKIRTYQLRQENSCHVQGAGRINIDTVAAVNRNTTCVPSEDRDVVTRSHKAFGSPSTKLFSPYGLSSQCAANTTFAWDISEAASIIFTPNLSPSAPMVGGKEIP